MSCWLIITKLGEEPAFWQLGGHDDCVVRVLEGKQKAYNISPRAIADAQLPADESIVLVWAPMAVRQTAEVKRYLERLKLEHGIRVWIHFGSRPSVGLTYNRIRASWHEVGWVDLTDPEIDKKVRPFSIAASSETWDRVIQDVAARLAVDSQGREELCEALEQGWEYATRYYFESAVMRELLEELFSLYLDLKAYLLTEEIKEDYAQAVLGSIRSKTKEDEEGESGAERLMTDSALLRKEHTLAEGFYIVWPALREVEEAAGICAAAGAFCEWFENLSEAYSQMILNAGDPQ